MYEIENNERAMSMKSGGTVKTGDGDRERTPRGVVRHRDVDLLSHHRASYQQAPAAHRALGAVWFPALSVFLPR
jgi:hypothetical protein